MLTLVMKNQFLNSFKIPSEFDCREAGDVIG